MRDGQKDLAGLLLGLGLGLWLLIVVARAVGRWLSESISNF